MTRNKKNLIIPSIDEMCAELGFQKKKYGRYDRPFNEVFTDRLQFSYSYFGSKDYVYVDMNYGINNLKLMDLYKKLWEYEGEIIPSMIGINCWYDRKGFDFWGVSEETDVKTVIKSIKERIKENGYIFFDKYHDWDFLCEKLIEGKVSCNDTPGYGACALYLNGKRQEAINYYEGKIKKAKEKFEKLGRKLREEEYQPFRDN